MDPSYRKICFPRDSLFSLASTNTQTYPRAEIVAAKFLCFPSLDSTALPCRATSSTPSDPHQTHRCSHSGLSHNLQGHWPRRRDVLRAGWCARTHLICPSCGETSPHRQEAGSLAARTDNLRTRTERREKRGGGSGEKGGRFGAEFSVRGRRAAVIKWHQNARTRVISVGVSHPAPVMQHFGFFLVCAKLQLWVLAVPQQLNHFSGLQNLFRLFLAWPAVQFCSRKSQAAAYLQLLSICPLNAAALRTSSLNFRGRGEIWKIMQCWL